MLHRQDIAPDTILAVMKIHATWLVTAFLLFIFSFPFNGGSQYNLPLFTLLLLFFVFAVPLLTRKTPDPILAGLRRHYPMLLWLLGAFALSSLVSLTLVLVDENITRFQKFAAIWRHIMYLLFTLYAFTLARLCTLYRVSHARIFLYLCHGVLVLTILLLLTYHFAGIPDEYVWFHHTPFGHHIRDTSNIAEIAAVAATVFLLYLVELRSRSAVITTLLLVSSWTFVAWSGGRAGITAIIITAIGIVALARIYSHVPWRNILLAGLLVLLSFTLSAALSTFSWNGLQRTTATIEKTTEQIESVESQEALTEVGNRFSSGRVHIWITSIESLKESPWFGLGPNGYLLVPDQLKADNPHNLVIQFYVEWGIIGGSLLLILLCYLLHYVVMRTPETFRTRDISGIACIAAITTLTLNGLLTGTYFMLQPLFLLVTAFAGFPLLKHKEFPQTTDALFSGQKKGA